MRRILFVLFTIVGAFSSLKALDASVSYATFKGSQQNYVEVYLHIVGNTVNFQTVDTGQYQASVEVLILFKQLGNIVKFDKYRLTSPVSSFPMDFIDQRRFGLPDGTYQLEVSISDNYMENNVRNFDKIFTLDYQGEELQQSDIQLLSSFKSDSSSNQFVKNGYYLETLPFNFYNKRASRLVFYNEIYNADKALDGEFLIRYALDRVQSDGSTKRVLLGHKKREPRPVNIILLQKDISELTSGNYHLVVEIRSREDELLSSKTVFFQRSNPTWRKKRPWRRICATNLSTNWIPRNCATA